MSRIVIPDGGIIPVEHSEDWPTPLNTNRQTSYRYDLLSPLGKKFGELDGVSGGSLEWDANAQVKGGGRITAAYSNALGDRKIRINQRATEESLEEFATGTGGFGQFIWFGDPRDLPKRYERVTAVSETGIASLEIEYGNPSAPGEYQYLRRVETGLVIGNTYTLVLRVKNPSAANAVVTIFGEAAVNIPTGPGWQTVTLLFEANSESKAWMIENRTPVDGHTLHIDRMALFDGEAIDFSGDYFVDVPFSWLHARVRPVLCIEGMPDTPLGTFVPSTPVTQWSEDGGRREIELLDRTSILQQDSVISTYAVKSGQNIMSRVRSLIASTGEGVGAFESSSATLKKDMVWPAGTSKLTIINELLDAGGFMALWCDGYGTFRTEMDVSPLKRPYAFRFADGISSIFLPSFSVEDDIYSVPNRVVMTSQGSGDDEAWTVVAANRNKESPYSYQSRGRWITDEVKGVEADSKADLLVKAKARLASLSSVRANVDIAHAPIPNLRVNNVVRFRRKPAGIDAAFVVVKTSLDLNPTALAKSTLMEVSGG